MAVGVRVMAVRAVMRMGVNGPVAVTVAISSKLSEGKGLGGRRYPSPDPIRTRAPSVTSRWSAQESQASPIP